MWVPALLSLAGVVLAASPQQTWRAVRNGIRDLLRPGQLAALSVQEHLRTALEAKPAEESLIAELQSSREQIQSAKLRERKLAVEAAKLHERIEQLETALRIPKAKQQSRPLVVSELLPATVLSRDRAAELRRRTTIALGADARIDPETYILDGEQPLLDQGETTGIAAGQSVSWGRNMVGRIADVGVWTSTIRLITDPDYRGLARLARSAEGGMIWGATGRLRGNGSAKCVLHSIDATELVSVGDLVFTAEQKEALSGPMFYGRVTKAELRPGAVEWEIEIEPAADLQQLTRVHVLRNKLNPLRMMAQ